MSANYDDEIDARVALSSLDSRRLDRVSRSCGIARSKLEKAARMETKLTQQELKQVAKALREVLSP